MSKPSELTARYTVKRSANLYDNMYSVEGPNCFIRCNSRIELPMEIAAALNAAFALGYSDAKIELIDSVNPYTVSGLLKSYLDSVEY
jgi:hypothetical protein